MQFYSPAHPISVSNSGSGCEQVGSLWVSWTEIQSWASSRERAELLPVQVTKLEFHRSDLVWGLECCTIFSFLYLQEIILVLILWVFQNCLHWTMCWHISDVKNKQGQKGCFFTGECSAIITALKNQYLISTRFPTSTCELPMETFMKADLPTPLVLPDVWGKSGLVFTVI